MVWGMNLPSSFGEFWPDGDFEDESKTRSDGYPILFTLQRPPISLLWRGT